MIRGLIAVVARNRFYNDVRTENMCVPEGRPTQLDSFAFVRVECRGCLPASSETEDDHGDCIAGAASRPALRKRLRM